MEERKMRKSFGKKGGSDADARKPPGKRFDKQSAILFVKNLPSTATEDMLSEIFPDAEEIRIPRYDDSGNLKGFAFVEFEDESTVEEYMQEKQGVELEGNALYLDYGEKKGGRSDRGRGGPRGRGRGGYGGDRRGKSFGVAGRSKILFVTNLAYRTDKYSLQAAFDEFGAVDARVVMFADNPRKSRGFGFVDFQTAEDAQEAFNAMKGQDIDGREVYIDFAEDRESGGGGGGRGGYGGGYGRGRGGGFRGGR